MKMPLKKKLLAGRKKANKPALMLQSTEPCPKNTGIEESLLEASSSFLEPPILVNRNYIKSNSQFFSAFNNLI